MADGIPLSHGVGTTNRRAMTIVGTAYAPWYFWDGRKDSQWSQALGPMESAVEHGGNRTFYAHLVAKNYTEVHHYNTAPDAPTGHSELEPLNLSEGQLGRLSPF